MFFLRRYTMGKAKSGTTDITSWDEFPPYEEFRAVCESFGAGKYIMFQRGKGIRGMRKVNEYIVEEQASPSPPSSSYSKDTDRLEKLLVFAAEEFGVESETLLSVKKNIPVGDMSDADLFSALDQITKSAEGDGSLARDVKAILGELKGRSTGQPAIKEAETSTFGGSKLGFGAGMLVGGLGGVATTAYYYRGKIQDMESRMEAMEASMKETEQELKREAEQRRKKEKAAEAVRKFDSGVNLDASFLAEFNRKNTATDF